MLFLQTLLFFLFGIPAFAVLFDPPPAGTLSKGSSAYGPYEARPAFSVVSKDIKNARGYWYRDDPNLQIRKVMFVKGAGTGYKDGSVTIIQLGKVEGITNADDLTPRPTSWTDLTLANVGDITGEPWRRYTYVSANLTIFQASHMTCIAFTA